MLRFLMMMALAGLLVSCAGDKAKEKEEAEGPTQTAEELYAEAESKMAEEKYASAVKAYEEVERQYPYSPLAAKSQLMAGFASYKNTDYDSAIAVLENFVKQHPGNEEIAYAYYLIAVSYYEQISDIGRDQKMAELAEVALQDVIRRFPDSDFAKDARLKLDLVRDHLAGKEMEVGRYYLKRGELTAAVSRFAYVVAHYQTTNHVPEALHRLVEAYLALGITDEAVRYGAVLGHNYPGSVWYERSFALLKGKHAVPEGETSDSWFVNKIKNIF